MKRSRVQKLRAKGKFIATGSTPILAAFLGMLGIVLDSIIGIVRLFDP